jgi:hypothetical protein
MSIFKRTFLPVLVLCLLWNPGFGQIRDTEKREAPPVISAIPDVIVDQNTELPHAVDLWQYTSDPDTPPQAILFSVTHSAQSSFRNRDLIRIEENRYVNISPDDGWTGEEVVLIEANDGTDIGYATFKVIVRSTEAGHRIEAEDEKLVERKGGWVELSQWNANGLHSNRPGDSLRLKWTGSFLSLALWGRDMHKLERYFESPDMSVLSEAWKTYRPGVALVRTDKGPPVEIDLAKAEKEGWSEWLVASGLEPGDHELELMVKEGFVGVDVFRASPIPLIRFDASAADPYGTPLADIVIKFFQEGALKTALRTTPDGRIPTFFGLQVGLYDLEIAADSNPGYTRDARIEENIVPQKLEDVEIKPGEPTKLEFVLSYSNPGLRSLSVIRRPIGTVPSILMKGSTLEVECLADKKPKKIRVFLQGEGPALELKVVSSVTGPRMIRNGLEPGLLVKAKVPADVPDALYGLRIELDGREDQASRAVKVVSAFKSPYKFVHLSDLHIQGTAENVERNQTLARIVEEINALAPEFVLISGDNVDCGARPDYLRFLELLSTFKVPTFVIPGNHDHYFWHMRYLGYGHDEYRKYLGQSFFTFDYGPDRFVGIDTGDYEKIYETPLEGIHAAQWPWLMGVMESSKLRPQGLLCLFAHYDHTQGLPEISGYSNQLVGLFDKYPVDLYLWGHGHTNNEESVGPRPTLSLETGSTQQGTYRVIEVQNSKVMGHQAMTAQKKDTAVEKK